MILKGSARSAPGELAHHLLREDTNESVRVLELRGVASLDLPGALAELDGMGAGARSRRPLYHASINTPVSEQLTADQQRIARERLAAKMGLEGQPYAVVEHVKAGRQHTHIVWSRIDQATGKAISDSHNYRRHEEVARELEREFGHVPVLGAHIRDKETEPRPARTPSWGEHRQAERSGLTPQETKRQITELWQRTRTGVEFAAALADAGYTLARGDRRDFVLIDRAGEVHGLTRRIDGAKAAQVRERMAGVNVDRLPLVDQAQQRIRQLQTAQPPAKIVSAEQAAPVPEPVRLSSTSQAAIEAATVVPERILAVPELPVPPSSPEAPRRPSAALFVQIFGWVIDAYQRAVDRLSGWKEPTGAVKVEKPEVRWEREPGPAASPPQQPDWNIPEHRKRLLDELREELERPGSEADYGFSR